MALNEQAAPHRRYELKLTLGVDSWSELRYALDSIGYDLAVKADADENTVRIVSGGYSSGWTLDVDCDASVTHDSWAAALREYVDARKTAKAARVEEGDSAPS